MRLCIMLCGPLLLIQVLLRPVRPHQGDRRRVVQGSHLQRRRCRGPELVHQVGPWAIKAEVEELG